MKSTARLAASAAALVLSFNACASADVVLASDFDNNVGSTDVSATGNLTLATASQTVTVQTTGTESTSTTVLSAIAPGAAGFVSGVGAATTDVVTLSSNLNAGDRADPRGYSLTFTPNASYDLALLTVVSGQINSGGGDQNFQSTLSFELSDTGGTVASGDTGKQNYFNDKPIYFPNTFDLTGTSLVAGETYTLSITSNGLDGGGAFISYDGFSLESVVVPEPTSLAALAGLSGLALLRRRA